MRKLSQRKPKSRRYIFGGVVGVLLVVGISAGAYTYMHQKPTQTVHNTVQSENVVKDNDTEKNTKSTTGKEITKPATKASNPSTTSESPTKSTSSSDDTSDESRSDSSDSVISDKTCEMTQDYINRFFINKKKSDGTLYYSDSPEAHAAMVRDFNTNGGGYRAYYSICLGAGKIQKL